jgi:cytosine/creatinine deaminase
MQTLNIPRSTQYSLTRALIPSVLLEPPIRDCPADWEDCVLVDLVIDNGRVAQVRPSRAGENDVAGLDLEGRMVWPTFVDMHAHLDKGHVIPRVRPDGTLHGGYAATISDRARWALEDMKARMEFGLQCAYAHGVSAIRTHLDSVTFALAERSFALFAELRHAWADRVDLQAVAIAPMKVYLSPLGSQLAELAARHGGVLGGVTDTIQLVNGVHEHLDEAFDALFALARERGLDIDLHVDQSSDPAAFALPNVARAKLRSKFEGRVVCGHCVNLSLQSDEAISVTLALAREADLSFVSMPTPMMYLMDRAPGRTPRWRGVTAAKEIIEAGLPLAIGGDNCRDAWFPYGDHDMLDTLKQAVRVFQTDDPMKGALEMATRAPADIIRRPDLGRIGVGLPAKLVIFSARSLNSLFCRDQADRIVINGRGRVLDALPRHEDLARVLGI